LAHDGNPASHPELLQMLADEFAAAGHDEKHVLRCICNSNAYQRSSQPLSENVEDTTRYSTMALKQLSAEVLHDAVAQVTDGRLVDDKDLVKSVTNAGRDFWLWSFSNQAAATEFTHGVPQSLKMLNSGLANARPPLVLEMSRHSPFRISNIREEMHQNIECVQPSGGYPVFDRRVAMLNEMEQGFQSRQRGAKVIADHRDIYAQAARMMRSSKLDALDLKSEPKEVRESYGNSEFGNRCVLARRLLEVGVKFVGINSGLDWDTHNNNWSRMKPHFPIIDQGWSALLTDLESRGMLQDTLVIWMGEFGRDPKINNKNANAGREHYARAWTTVLSGAGIKTGQVIGRTSEDGSTVEERPISPIDYMATLSKILGIDGSKEYSTPDGRPIRVVEAGATPVAELF
jgi:hypothetical protein